MPEGDTVLRAARTLHKALSGRPLTRSDLRMPAVATVDLTGQTVVEVASVGKHMLARTDAGLTLHSHFQMDGSWHVYRHGQRWRGGPTHEVRAILENQDWVIVGYRLPVLDVIETRDETTVVGHLGPDILAPQWDEQEALRRILSQPDRSVAEALLDQRNVAGIGNLYKNESLFLAGADPWATSSKLDILKILRIAHPPDVGQCRSLVPDNDGEHQTRLSSLGIREERSALPALWFEHHGRRAGCGTRGPDHI